MRRGSPIICLYFDFGVEDLREEARKRVISICKHLFKEWTPDGTGKLYIIPFTEILSEMSNIVNEKKYMYVLLKKMMYHYASVIAKREKAVGIVTGEIIGEHASQTAWNLNIISHGCEYQVLRPVSCLDKSDVFKLLKLIDEKLYVLASKSIEPCRTIAKVKPTTVADANKITEYENKLLAMLHEKNIDVLDKTFIIEF
jgi:thiamine biosynthesis protein ThiI